MGGHSHRQDNLLKELLRIREGFHSGYGGPIFLNLPVLTDFHYDQNIPNYNFQDMSEIPVNILYIYAIDSGSASPDGLLLRFNQFQIRT
jgi:hypothetical protein